MFLGLSGFRGWFGGRSRGWLRKSRGATENAGVAFDSFSFFSIFEKFV